MFTMMCYECSDLSIALLGHGDPKMIPKCETGQNNKYEVITINRYEVAEVRGFTARVLCHLNLLALGVREADMKFQQLADRPAMWGV